MRFDYGIPALFLSLALGLNVGAQAASETVVQPPKIAPLPAKAVPDLTPHAIVTGFRSATFGSDESAVRAAIAKDFDVAEKAIVQSQNAVDRTTVLTVKVADVLGGGGGGAEIAYTFGYKTKKLIQVTVVWSKATDKDLTGERLLANGQVLRTYFTSSGYDPKTVVMNSELRDGILLFRGADAENHTTALMLHGVKTKDENKPTETLIPDSLVLFYLAETKDPDVFRLKPGTF